MQNGGHIRTPNSAVEGGTIEVDVGSGTSSIEVSTGGSPQSYPVDSSGKVSIPVPPGSAGGVIWICIGQGLAKKTMLIEIIASSP